MGFTEEAIADSEEDILNESLTANQIDDMMADMTVSAELDMAPQQKKDSSYNKRFSTQQMKEKLANEQ